MAKKKNKARASTALALPARLRRLTVPASRVTLPQWLMLTLLALIVALGARSLWFVEHGAAPFGQFEGTYILTTNDGFAWAEGARDIIEGNENEPRSRAAFPVSQVLAAVTAVTPAGLNVISVYLPMLLGALLVIPVVYLGGSMGSIWLGVLGAVLAATAEVYLARTIPGAVDTDMLNITLAATAAAGVIHATRGARPYGGLVGAIAIATGTWWYPTMWIVFVGMFAVLAVYLFAIRSLGSEQLRLLAVILASLAAYVNFGIGLIAPVIVFFAWPYTKHLPRPENPGVLIAPAAIAAIAISIPAAGFVYDKLRFYFLRQGDSADFAFAPVQSTVYEMTVTNIADTAGMLSGGHWALFLLALAGTGLMFWRERSTLIALPMLGLGLLSFAFGIRFGIFAAPWLALGLAYLLLALAHEFGKRHATALALAVALLPVGLQVNGAWQTMQAPIVLTPTAQAASDLREAAPPGSKAITWWDYGYLLRYYSNLNVVIDGGLIVNDQLLYATSSALLCTDQRTANRIMKRIAYAVDHQGFQWRDNDLIEALSSGEHFDAPQPHGQQYLFLNDEMLDELQVIQSFCNTNLTTGERGIAPVATYQRNSAQQGLGLWQQYQQNPRAGSRIVQDPDISNVIFVSTDTDGRVLDRETWRIRPRGDLTFIVRVNRGDSILVDEQMLNSLVVQALLLGQVDPTLFEEVVSSATAKAWRIR